MNVDTFLKNLSNELYNKSDIETVDKLEEILTSIDHTIFHKPIELKFKDKTAKPGRKIALSGKMCSGKTTSSDAFIAKWNTFKRASIAGRLKEIAIKVFGMNPDPKMKDRALLQRLGTDLRIIDENAWLNVFFNGLSGDTVCDDVRYLNELEAFNKNGFITVRLKVDPDVQMERINNLYPDFDLDQLAHKSETDLDNANGFHATMTSEEFVKLVDDPDSHLNKLFI
jgi:hypothetical protein